LLALVQRIPDEVGDIAFCGEFERLVFRFSCLNDELAIGQSAQPEKHVKDSFAYSEIWQCKKRIERDDRGIRNRCMEIINLKVPCLGG